MGTTGFLKKLPAFPRSFGFGNLLERIAITALLTSLLVGFEIPFFNSYCSIAPYLVLIFSTKDKRKYT